MSFLSGNTKKVSVYGRKAEVRVVNRQSTFISLEKDENDPFGFFKPQTKPRATYGRSRASVLPSTLRLKHDKPGDETFDHLSATNQSSAPQTCDSSSSSQPASSSPTASSPNYIRSSPVKKDKHSRRKRDALSDKIFNEDDAVAAKSLVHSSPNKAATKAPAKSAVDATPKQRRIKTSKDAVDDPPTFRKSTAVTAPTFAVPSLPTGSTSPATQPAGRTSRRAAQAARMAIQDYDFTDRDMTPRRPVPTKSYFAEKARQLAQLSIEEKGQHFQQQNQCPSPRKTATNAARKPPRRSTVSRPRHTTTRRSAPSSAIAVSDSSLSSCNGISDSSFDAGGTSQSSFSLVGTSSDDSFVGMSNKSTSVTKAKARQNQRVTRRIAATSDDEDDEPEKQASDDQDPTLQLAAQVADLDVSGGDEATSTEDHLSDLLASVSQTKPKSFADVVQQLRSSSTSTKATPLCRRVEKIGEASYSEVFKISASCRADEDGQEAVVLKIIPISAPTCAQTSSNVKNDELPSTSSAADVEREIRLMQLVGRELRASDSFVSLRAAHVVRGAYPAALLQAWDRWDAKRRAKTGEGAENVRPHVLGRQQVYAVLVMTDGGTDLESLRIKSWLQAASIFWQVVGGLGTMEAKYEFEHRDLHWGNILVQAVVQDACAETRVEDKVSSWLLNPSVSGVKATVIDFTLSRACTTSGATNTKSRYKKTEVLYYPFDDESLFQGSGDTQFEVYREMRIATQGSWQAYCPTTNVLWLRYLAHKLVHVKCKSHKIPKASNDLDAQRELRAYTVLQNAVTELDDAVQKLLKRATGSRRLATGASRSLHTRTARSALPSSAAGGARKGRATMAVTPPLNALDEETTLESAAQLKAYLD